MRFSPGRFNRFLSGNVGQDFGWRKASACPCTPVENGSSSPRFECPLCFGRGRLYAEEVACRAGMTNQTPQKAVAAFGSWEPGDAIFTIPLSSAMYACGQYDRIRALNSTNPFSEMIVPGRNDRLQGSIVRINRVFWLNDAGDAIVEGGVPAIGNDGSLSWASGAPPEGRPFTVEGVRYDEFMVFKPLSSDRNIGVTGLPLKLLARRYDLFGR